MRKLIAVVASTAALLLAGMANAAPVALVFERTAPGATTWNLTMDVPDDVTIYAVAFGIVANDQTSFVIGQPATSIDPFIADGGFSTIVTDPTDSSRRNIVLTAGTQQFMVNAPVADFVLGVMNAPGLTVPAAGCTGATGDPGTCTFFINGDQDGGTIQEAVTFTSLDYTVRFVPEPGMMVLLGLGLAGLGLARRSA